MSDEINAFFQLIEGWLGFHPATIAAIALALVLVLAALSFYLLVRLRNSRGIVHRLAKRLGYEPPFGDGEEIRQQEFRNELVQRGREMKIKRLEQRVAELEGEANTRDSSLAAFQQRYTELDDQLQQATLRQEELTTQAGERTQAHQSAIAQFEQRLHDMEAESHAKRAELQQHAKELEEQLQQATLQAENEKSAARQQLDDRNTTIERLELQVRDLEAEGDLRKSGLDTLQTQVSQLELQLQQASLRHEELSAQSSDQAQAHQQTVAHLEQRLRDLESENTTSLTELQQHSRELEDQLQHAADHAAEAILAAPSAPPPSPESQTVAPGSSAEFLCRAEWITACAVGPIRPLGLVAAEAYAATALAADPHNSGARQLLAELARLRPASPRFLPSVVEAVTTFDKAAAAFFGPNLARAADFAEMEAIERYQAGLGQAALLVVNLTLALRQQSAPGNTPETLRLQEMKTALLARLSSGAKPSNHMRNLASL